MTLQAQIPTDVLAVQFDQLHLPETLRGEVIAQHAQPPTGDGNRLWPPRPGYDQPDVGSIRFWGDFDLAAWYQAAPHSFGPYTELELQHLTSVSRRLKLAGEGARVLWALDVLRPGEWTRHPRTGLCVAELVCAGPWLSDSVLADIRPALHQHHWGLIEDVNEVCEVNRTPCYVTHWIYGV
ncbi:hypothetical protein AFM11_30095 [Mycolicibacterium wolinskyi]|uniref:Uncharacterized protein n=1 Tax=Mycolicibacterium wolinskyi TaxID=59750 RepID=A0A132PDN0_9MYCO|nr:hypothetical protein [Mycolicibacterium wolinskyi]KWX20439.1 hypothetical protein AFM11_30095 [Mycolicibacterium wolinskyi]